MKQNKPVNTDSFKLISSMPEQDMKSLVERYITYMEKYKYLRYSILGVVAVIVGYNFFVAGKRFPLAELNTVKIVMASVMGVFILALLVLAGVLFTALRKLKKALNAVADKEKKNRKLLRKEFHAFVKLAIGGPGMR